MHGTEVLLAYVDPTAGGMLVQILLGGVAGLCVILKYTWARIRQSLGMAPVTPPTSDPPQCR